MVKPNKSLILDEATDILLRKIARREDRSQSSVIRQAIRLYGETACTKKQKSELEK